MSELITADHNSVRFLTLNRPEKRNALNDALISALKNELRRADAETELRAIVIRGAGKDFCSGADLSALQKISESSYEENLEDARSLAELFELIRKVRLPVIAAVRGRALAGGCGLALACDLVVGDSTSVFGFPEVKIGFVPAMVAAVVRRNLGEKESFALLTQGFEMSGIEANSIHLINAIVNDETFDEDVLEYAAAYARLSRSAVEMTKRLLYDIDGDDLSTAIEKGVIVNAEARMTDDYKAGIAKFLDK